MATFLKIIFFSLSDSVPNLSLYTFWVFGKSATIGIFFFMALSTIWLNLLIVYLYTPGIDEIIYCMEGTFRLTCDGQSYICNPGDVLYIPKDNHIAYECDEKCVIFYAAYPHDWKQQAGIKFVPGIDPEDMPQ